MLWIILSTQTKEIRMIDETVIMERTGTLFENYLTSFGKAWVAFYCFPCLEDPNRFPRYLNALTTALKRANCRPVYSWSYDVYRGCFNLILIVSGYFRDDMNDVTDAVQRLWKLYSPFPIQFVAEMPVNYESKDQDKIRILDVMNRMQFACSPPQRVLAPYQRSFACSKV